jgi:hypothetical protein
VYEGAFRILRALGDGRSLDAEALTRASGEASSVVREVVERYPQWFADDDGAFRCTERGLAALAREWAARRVADDIGASWQMVYESIAEERGPAKRELDQVYVTAETAARRARLLVESGEHQRGLAFLGDDDLTSIAVQLAGAARKVTVLDTDTEILALLARQAEAHAWEIETLDRDLRYPVPRKLKSRFGAVFTDPPYAIEGFRLFVSRAVEMLKPDGRLYVCFGQSRRASERGLHKQRVLGEAGLLIEAVHEGFNQYLGAESIGATSSLWRCRVTPETRPLIRGEVDGPLYTSRSPEP